MRKPLRLVNLPMAMALVVALVPESAVAQVTAPPQRPERPTQGLFGSGYGDLSQQLVWTASIGGGYDDDLLTREIGPGTTGSRRPRAGQFGFGNTGLSYQLSGERANLGAFVGGSGRYYPDLSDTTLLTYSAGVNTGLRLSSRLRLSTSHRASLQPNHLAVFFPQGFDATTPPVAPLDPSGAIESNVYRSYRHAANLSFSASERLAFYGGYHYYTVDPREGGAGRFDVQGGRAGMTYQIARGLSARAGYGVSESRPKGDSNLQPYESRTIDASIDFSRAISLSRRSSLSFSTGVTGVNDQANDTRYFATGHATFGYELGRSWTSSLGYRRSLTFDQTLRDPVIADAVTAGFSGLITRRLSMNASAGYSRGTVGLVSAAPDFRAATAGVGLRWALTRMLGISAQYGAYHYRFDRADDLPGGLRPELKRQSVTVSLDVQVPLFTRTRRADATR